MTAAALVLGLGNVLLRDDGVGVWIANSLSREFTFSEDLTIVEGGTLGLDLLPRLQGVKRLLLADAVKLGGEPGAISRLAGEEVRSTLDLKISPHQIGVADLLGAARLLDCEPRQLVLWGIEPERLDPGTGFSPRVEGALVNLRSAVLGELESWGIRGRRRSVCPPPAVWWRPRIGGGGG